MPEGEGGEAPEVLGGEAADPAGLDHTDSVDPPLAEESREP